MIEIASSNGGGSTQVDFTSIPQIYTDLRLIISARTNSSASSYGDVMEMKINTATTNFVAKRLEGYAATIQGSTETNSMFGRATNANFASDLYCVVELYICDYASTSRYKVWHARSGTPAEDSTYTEKYIYSGRWNNNSAITSLSIFASGTFNAQSKFSLYGIKNS